jgi:UDP-GlcNAc:undecaprenyl-phosphate GlcNAc-1-phosphate transferase
MLESFFPYSFSFALSYVLTRLLIPAAPRLGLVDIPSARKKHSGEIPLVGGLGIYGSVLICTMLFTTLQIELLCIVALGGLLTTIGTLDDKFGVSPRSRLMVQFMAGILLVFGADIELSNLGDLFGFGIIGLGIFTIPCTAIGIAALANAYNMTDGIDGLAASLGIVAFSSFILTLSQTLNSSEIMVLSFYIISLFIYLIFNFAIKPLAPQKVFMGDAGSMFIGFSIAAFAIYFSQNARFNLEPAVVVWFVAVPLFDMVATMVGRMRKGQSPFYPDRTHIHHLLMHLGLTEKSSLGAMISFSTACSFAGYFFHTNNVPSNIIFLTFTVVFLLYLTCILKAWKLKRIFR